MTLTLDPRFPLLWRTPHSLQLGVDDPPVELRDVTTGHEKMLSALAVGLTPEGLTLIGRDSGLSTEQISNFERAINPVLLRSADDRHTPAAITPLKNSVVEIDGAGLTADRLDYRLREAEFAPHRWPGSDSAAPSVAIIVGDYVLEPERRGRWLRRDVPHLPIVFGDTGVTIGPFIEPGAGPCLYCLELHRTDADPAWPALASQLLGRVSTAHQPLLASEAATIATRMILTRSRHLARGTAAADPANSLSLTINADTGEHRRRVWQRHPDCACSGITAADGQYRQETVRASFGPDADHGTPTRTDEVERVPA